MSDYGAMGTRIGRMFASGLNGDAYRNAYDNEALKLSRAGMAKAHADLYNEQAAQMRQRGMYQTPEFASQIAAALAGLSDGQGKQLDGFINSGSWGEVAGPALPIGQEGPPEPAQAPRPGWATPDAVSRYNTGRAAHLMNLGATGNSNAEQMAKAYADLVGQGRIDAAMAKPDTIPTFGKAMAASQGKELFHQGANGVMDKFTGAESLNDVGKSAALENRAQAGNAAASAALHRAQIPEVQARIDLTRSKIAQPLILTDKDGNQTVYDPKAKADKPPTEFQSKSATFGARAKEAHDILGALDGKYNVAAAMIGGGNGITAAIANPLLGNATQKAIQAQRDFINAVLRQESGAVISDSEFANAAKQYFPQLGDSKEVIAQKRRNRETAIKGFTNAAGKAAFEAPPIVPSGPNVLESVPEAAIAHLRSNPHLAPAFAAKYGKEATDAALRKGM